MVDKVGRVRVPDSNSTFYQQMCAIDRVKGLVLWFSIDCFLRKGACVWSLTEVHVVPTT